MTAFSVLLGEGRSQLAVKRSRFIGVAAPVRDENEAARVLAVEGEREAGATHAAFAFRVGKDRGVLVERYSDAGEPHGTAGPPLLDLLRGQELDCVLVAVVRHYGGVKLGTGGLARAYQEAGRLALTDAPRGTRVLCRRFDLVAPYGLFGSLSAHLPARGWLVKGCSFGVQVEAGVWVPEADVELFTAYLGQLGGGRIEIEDGGLAYLARSDHGLEGDSCWTL